MTKLCLFAANLLMFKMIAEATVIADSQAWTHKDIVANGVKESRSVISPRMDFDEWTPLGRGDPLKNDPTFDYLPPVLDKVHYWKPSPSPVGKSQYSSSSTGSPVQPLQTVNYNRRFFLTDFSKKEPAAYVQYTQYKRPPPPPLPPQIAGGGYHYPMPKTPLPMLTPPPYQRPTAVMTTTVEPMDVSFLDAGNSAAESKQPPTVRAPPPPPPSPMMSAAAARPALTLPSAIKALLQNEVDDRTTVTTRAPPPPTTTTTTRAPPPTTTGAPPTADPLFSRYKQSTVTGGGSRPMYLIIQGHSKVKTYGLLSKPDDSLTVQEHNHIGNGPDEQSRKKRNGF